MLLPTVTSPFSRYQECPQILVIFDESWSKVSLLTSKHSLAVTKVSGNFPSARSFNSIIEKYKPLGEKRKKKKTQTAMCQTAQQEAIFTITCRNVHLK